MNMRRSKTKTNTPRTPTHTSEQNKDLFYNNPSDNGEQIQNPTNK